MTTRDGEEPELPGPVTPDHLGWRPGDHLWPLEVDMVDRAKVGQRLDLGEGPLDPDVMPDVMKSWGPERTIRAAVLGHLLVDKKQHLHAKGVRIRGARISGCLDLEGATLRCPLRLENCYLDGPQPDLDYATVSLLVLTGCQLAGLAADALTVTKGLYLVGSAFTGPVRLAGADITGNLAFTGARLNREGRDGNALVADRLKVGGDVSLDQEFTAAGAVSLVGTDITGNLVCTGARLNRADSGGNALVAAMMKVGGAVFLSQEFTAAGAVQLVRADITGNLQCTGARLNRADSGGNALVADGLKVGGDVFLDQEFTAAGAVRLAGADITGNLQCTGARLNREGRDGNALVAAMMKVGGTVVLGQEFTAAGAVSLVGTDITGNLVCTGARLNRADSAGNALVAVMMKVGGAVFLGQEFTAAGAVQLVRADITGNLECTGARLNRADSGGNALVADGLKVGGDVFLNQEFTAAGAVRLAGADITGNLQCTGARLNREGRDGNALVAAMMKVGGTVVLGQEFTAAGAVSLVGTDITGNLVCTHARLNRADTDGNALVADGLKVGGTVILSQEFTAAGAVSLSGADITGNLQCTGARLNRADTDGNALVGEVLKVGGDVFLDQEFTAAGAVSLLGADITANLQCSGARLNRADTGGNALVADGLKVGGDVFLDQEFTAAGAVSLLGADISGNLDCSGARLNRANSGGNALVADGLKVGGEAFLSDGFTAAGTVSFQSVSVGGSLWLSLGEPADDKAEKPAVDKARTALDATGAQITHKLWWLPTVQVAGLVILEDAVVGQLEDSWVEPARDSRAKPADRPNGYWPRADQGRLRLDGFTYSRIGGRQDAEHRLKWIGSQPKPPWGKRAVSAIRAPRVAWRKSKYIRARKHARRRSPHGFASQPYEQLAKVYQQAGQDREARKVALGRRRDLRLYGDLAWYRRALSWLLDKTIQYGYQTWRAVLALAVVYAAAVVIFWIAQHHASLIVPVMDTTSLRQAPTAMRCTSSYPCFYPAGYAIDTVVPIINVHQADYWGPNGHAPWGHALVVFTWVCTVLGWALATLAVAGYTGLARNSDAL